MLFNAPEFVFIFLPFTWVVYQVLAGYRLYRGALGWLVLASLIFYGYWNPPYVFLICSSILVNHFVGRNVCPSLSSLAESQRRWLLYGGVAFNLGLLGYFKYANFFLHTADQLFGTSLEFGRVILPLAISFFTFTQLAYLFDAYRGETGKYSLLEYSFFVTFFPHLIAGPIVQHHEIMPQVERGEGFRFRWENLAVGFAVFVVGLYKKMVLADGSAVYANPVFDLAAQQGNLSGAECWIGVLAYAFQLYFDFSGYSDMAIGLSYCFGFRLPLNFNSPYKATSIVDFWRRWHISLSRFLRNYLYIPLGGSRHGIVLRYRNLLITMLLGGLWHGAGWNFLIWGGLHGLYLAVNHMVNDFTKHLHWKWLSSPVAEVAGWALTMFAVVIAWVFFRATDFTSAMWLLQKMFGLPVAAGSEGLPSDLSMQAAWAWVILMTAIALLAPNSQQYFAKYQPALERAEPMHGFAWHPNLLHGMLLGCMIFFIVRRYFILEPTTFLYFNF